MSSQPTDATGAIAIVGMSLRVPGWAWLEPGPVVRSALAAARRGRVIVTPSLRYRAAMCLVALLPRSIRRRLSRRR